MNASLYGEIGKTIASIGSRHFARMFRDLVNSHLTAEASELQLCTCSQAQPLPLTGQTVAEAQERDPARTLQLHAAADSPVHDGVLTLYRAAPEPVFEPAERQRLQALSPLLFSMLARQLQRTEAQAGYKRADSPQDSLETRFRRRLRQAGLKLSRRETQVCLGLLAGRTAQEQAEQLMLTVNTVGSYQRRAAVKLKISGRHSLMRWLYADTAAPA